MADKISEKSILDLATNKSFVSRRDLEGRDADGKETKEKFNGFLRSFMGGDTQRQSTIKGRNAEGSRFDNNMFSGSQGASKRGRTGKTFERDEIGTGFDRGDKHEKKASDTGKSAEKISIREKAALRRAMEKTVSDEEYFASFGFGDVWSVNQPLVEGELELGQSLPIDPEVAKAAEEAAAIIWNILFPGAESTSAAEAAAAAESTSNPLAEAAHYLTKDNPNARQDGSALSDLGAATVEAADMATAMHTTNANAEMNIDAVLAALEDLLDGMPRQALKDALAKAAGAANANPEASLDQIAEALGLDSLTFSEGEETVSHNSLLAALDNRRLGQGVESAAVGDESLVDDQALVELPAEEAIAAKSTADEKTLVETATDYTMPIESALVDAQPAMDVEDGAAEAAVPGAAEENAAPAESQEDSNGWLKDILKKIFEENSRNRPINTETAHSENAVGDAPDAFAAWLQDNGIIGNNNEIDVFGDVSTIDPEALLNELDAFLTANGDKLSGTEKDLFLRLKANLETALQNGNAKAAPESPKGLVIEQTLMAAKEGGQQAAGVAANNSSKPAPTPTTASAVDSSVTGAPAHNTEAGLAPRSGIEENGGTPRESNQVAAAQTGQQGGQAAGKPLAPGGNASPMLDQIANIERLSEMMRMSNRRGVQNLTMQLSPPELGKVTVRVESKNGVISALFRVQNAESAAQLHNGLEQLKENLKAQGLELNQVEIRQEGFAAGGEGGGRQYAHETAQARTAHNAGKHDQNADGDEQDAKSVPETRNPNGALNLFA